ncbi:MAG: ribosome biogenesis GTPase Der [Bauldia sp.]|nr:ribosome biogenesis GTPase Der [Bauldia sp.]
MAKPIEVALVGRPNVGKSTLFNRLVGRRLALVDDTPGVTRDRRFGEGRLGDLAFTVVDTAGLEDAAPQSLAGRMREQTEAAIRSADVTLFMIDARAGVVPVDETFAALLRKAGRPVILVANKAEGRAAEAGLIEAFSLGLGDPVAISAEHGEGMADLRDAIAAHMPAAEEETEAPEEPDALLRVAVIGRPNAGKSTLINRILGEERLLTGPEAGITRDSIAVDWVWRGRTFRLFDTAGMRRKARVQEKLEKLSVADALRAIRFAEVVVLTLDATQPFDKQDLQLADLVEREGRAIVAALDKWDLVADRNARLKELRHEAERLLPQLRGMAVVPVSGLTGEGVDRLLGAVVAAYETWNRRMPTAALNRWLEGVTQSHPPPAVSGRRVKLRYMTQPKGRPPTFVLFSSRPEALPDSYRRYLVNGLRDAFDLPGVPIRLTLRKGDNPFASRKKKLAE